jgi:integrase
MGMKRPNGSGSVYKMNHKKLRKPYRAVITTGYTDEGKAIRKTIGTFAKSQDAWDSLTEYAHAPEKYSKRNITFGDAWKWMIADKHRQGIDTKKGKYDNLKQKTSLIWNMPMQKIRLANLQCVMDSCNKLSFSSHQALKSALNGTFKEAIKNDVINKNYATMLVLPHAEKSTMHRPFTTDELGVLWKNTDNKLVRVILIYIYTGMRPIELYKIKNSDVHISDFYMTGGVKTAAGRNRIIPIAQCILPFVKEIYNLSSFKKSETLIFKGYIPSALRHTFPLLCKDLGISPHRPHDTRHTFITMARNHDMDLFILKAIVGHSNATDVTSGVYTHKTVSQLIDAVNALPTSDYFTKKVEQRLSNAEIK